MAETPKELAKWTVMIYLAGANNLNEECVYALKEIRRAGMNINIPADAEGIINVIAQFDTGDLSIPTIRYKLLGKGPKFKSDEVDNTLPNFIVDEQETDEISYRKLLRDFIFTSIEDNPAEHYALVLSGHGSGTVDDFLPRGNGPWGKISIPELRAIFDDVDQKLRKAGRTSTEPFIDVLGMDSCLMGMAEIGYELSDYVTYMVAAEGFESNTGWPYQRLISQLLKNPDIGTPQLAIGIVDKYINYYRDYQIAALSVDLSASDLRRCKPLAAAIKYLGTVLSNGMQRTNPEDPEPALTKAVVLAHWKAQAYKFDQYIDLYDFCDLLQNESKEKDVFEACEAVKMILGSGEDNFSAKQLESGATTMVLRSCFSGSDVQHSHGLSLYFPWSRLAETYRDLQFNHDTDWYDFLRTYVEETRRHPRKCNNVNKKEKTAFGSVSPSLMGTGIKHLVDGSKGLVDGTRGLVDGTRHLVDGSKELLLNGASSMKNPPDVYFDCQCGTPEYEASATTSKKVTSSKPNSPALPVKSGGGRKRQKARSKL